LLLHLRVLLVGLLAGLLAVAFHLALDGTVAARLRLLAWAGTGWVGLLVGVLCSVALIVPAVCLVQWLMPEAAGSGIPQVKALAQEHRRIRWLRLKGVKFAGGALGIGGGLALGREGPTVQMGAALGQAVGELGRLAPAEQRELVILGAGAGLAGAFNAPLAGMLFVFEELDEPFRPAFCSAALLATASASAVCRLLVGQKPELTDLVMIPPPVAWLPAFLLLGLLGGLLGVAFNQVLLAAVRAGKAARQRLGAWPPGLLVAVLIGVVGWWDARWIGGGEALIDQGLQGGLGWRLALGLLLLRFVLTILSYATGAAGGLFAPLLVLGACLGVLAAQASPEAHRSAFVVAGMAAVFTGIVRAPLTGVLLMVEMASGYPLILALLASCLTAKYTADALGDRPIYEALLEPSVRPGGGGFAPPRLGGPLGGDDQAGGAGDAHGQHEQGDPRDQQHPRPAQPERGEPAQVPAGPAQPPADALAVQPQRVIDQVPGQEPADDEDLERHRHHRRGRDRQADQEQPGGDGPADDQREQGTAQADP
jgi:CIC family chloride channel protein